MEKMLTPLLTDKELFGLMSLIRGARRIVVCGHRSPDGDALGSSLGWAAYLRSLDKRVDVVMPNAFPDFLRWIPGALQVLFYDRQRDAVDSLLADADLIFCMDFNDPRRLQDMGVAVASARGRRVMIDHHPGPQTESFDFCVSRPSMCSTCEVAFRLICQLGGYENLSTRAAVALYTGMMTDTGGFTYNSNAPEIYIIVSLLLAKGLDKDKIYRNVFNNYSEHRLRFQGYVLYEKLHFLAGGRAAYFTLTREEMKRFHFIRGDAEGWVNIPLQVRGMKLSISLREDTEKDVVRVSLRSVDDFPCNKMAEEFFNGGGHLNAAGGELPFPMEEAVKTVERAVGAYAGRLLPKQA